MFAPNFGATDEIPRPADNGLKGIRERSRNENADGSLAHAVMVPLNLREASFKLISASALRTTVPSEPANPKQKL
jgi:hypothetical protein